MEVHRPEGIRLQKVLASAGVGSRRKCEILIERGQVKVNGKVVDELGVRVNPEECVIEVSGRRVNVVEGNLTLVLNKPRGVVSTMDDPQGRPDLRQYAAGYEERLFHVGRLDAETTGVLLLTSNGELANRLAHPSYGVEKVYVAKVEGRFSSALCTALKEGVDLEDGPVRATRCSVMDVGRESSLVEVALHEGRNRIVRRMFAHVGHPVTELVRTEFGPIKLGALKPGQVRELSNDEIGALMTTARL